MAKTHGGSRPVLCAMSSMSTAWLADRRVAFSPGKRGLGDISLLGIEDTFGIGILALIVLPGPGRILIPDLCSTLTLTFTMALSPRSVLVSVFRLGGRFLSLSVLLLLPLPLLVPVAISVDIFVAPRRGDLWRGIPECLV